MAAKHIKIARREATDAEGKTGPKAGYRSYMSSPSPLAKPNQDAIRASGGKTDQFDKYCAIFGDQFGNAPVNTAARTPIDEDARMGILHALLAKAGIKVKEPVGVVVEEPEVDPQITALLALAEELGVEVEMPTTPAPAPKTRTPRKPATPPAATNGEAWAPSAKNAPLDCTSGRLWRLNQAGMLMLRQPAGPPLTNAQAHAVLRSIES